MSAATPFLLMTEEKIMDRETIINLPRKILKFVIAAKVVNKTVRAAKKIYSFIPKYDRITGIDTDRLVQSHMPETK